MILHGAEPFFLRGGRHGILLVHGFTGSPAEMILLGNYLHRLGYTVMAGRLCGHGTAPEDMARTQWRDWYYSACDAYHLLKGCCDDICVIGLSMGGILALLMSINHTVKKAVSLSTPVFIAAERGLHLLPPRELSQNIYVPKNRRRLPAISARCNVSYEKMPLVCVYELLDCIDHLKKNLNRITAPVLVVQSSNDHTVDGRSGRYIYDRIQNGGKQILELKKSGHLVTLDIEKDTVFEKIKHFLLDNMQSN